MIGLFFRSAYFMICWIVNFIAILLPLIQSDGTRRMKTVLLPWQYKSAVEWRYQLKATVDKLTTSVW